MTKYHAESFYQPTPVVVNFLGKNNADSAFTNNRREKINAAYTELS